ncbi:MAG: glycosyltransferase family 2 protein [Crenarchaeota archaeon]|nr:glycosyltransferase family 2 protein [Thermoproteota archaeon]
MQLGLPLLSICIPTYNRRTTLERLLGLIIEQLTDDIIQNLEICISDNNSSDDTVEYIENLIDNYKGILKFSRNNQNYGATYNALKVYQMATGYYIWPMGDDDIIVDNAIPELLNFLSNNMDLDYIGMKCFDQNMKVIYYELLKSNEVYDQNQFINFIKNDKLQSFGFMGANIFKRKLIQEEASLFEWTIIRKNSWPHVYILLHNLTNIRKIGIFGPCVIQTGDGLFWYRNNWLIIKVLDNLDIIDMALKSERINEKFAFRLIRGILFSRSSLALIISSKIENKQQYSVSVKRIRQYIVDNHNTSFWLALFYRICRIFELIPNQILEVNYWLYKKIFRKSDYRMVLAEKIKLNETSIREGTSC